MTKKTKKSDIEASKKIAKKVGKGKENDYLKNHEEGTQKTSESIKKQNKELDEKYKK